MARNAVIGPLWREAPWTLKAYVYLTVAAYVIGFVVFLSYTGGVAGYLSPRFVLYVLVSVVLITGLLGRSRLAWIASVIWEIWTVLPTVLELVSTPRRNFTEAIIFGLVGVAALVLLFHPLTRRWCDKRLRDAGRPLEERSSSTTGGVSDS